MKLTQAELNLSDPQRKIDSYIEAHSPAEPEYLTALTHRTACHVINPRMICGPYEGRLLKMLVQITSAKRVVELGTFTGYSALSMAEGLPEGGIIDTIEIDDEQESFIRAQIESVEHGRKVRLHIGDALDVIPTLHDAAYDLAFIDADKRLYSQYFEALLPKMRKGAIVLADNTLWDGKVIMPETPKGDSQTIAIKQFNDMIITDTRVESIMLPLRDGLTLIRVL